MPVARPAPADSLLHPRRAGREGRAERSSSALSESKPGGQAELDAGQGDGNPARAPVFILPCSCSCSCSCSRRTAPSAVRRMTCLRTLRVHSRWRHGRPQVSGINAERWNMRHTAERCDESGTEHEQEQEHEQGRDRPQEAPLRRRPTGREKPMGAPPPGPLCFCAGKRSRVGRSFAGRHPPYGGRLTLFAAEPPSGLVIPSSVH